MDLQLWLWGELGEKVEAEGKQTKTKTLQAPLSQRAVCCTLSFAIMFILSNSFHSGLLGFFFFFLDFIYLFTREAET